MSTVVQAASRTDQSSCKQVLTIALAVFLFNLHITITNGIGIMLTLIGGVWYAYVEFSERARKQKEQVRLSKSGPEKA